MTHNRPTKESLAEIPELDAPKSKIVGRGLLKDRRIPLRALRNALGKTQVEIAQAAGMSQGDVSRVEAREDRLVSTLDRYAHALGGKLEVAIVVDGRRYALDV
jgi:hypothetical protein